MFQLSKFPMNKVVLNYIYISPTGDAMFLISKLFCGQVILWYKMFYLATITKKYLKKRCNLHRINYQMLEDVLKCVSLNSGCLLFSSLRKSVNYLVAPTLLILQRFYISATFQTDQFSNILDFESITLFDP